jgi:hypothetical protein
MKKQQAVQPTDPIAELQWSLLRWTLGVIGGALAVVALPRLLRLFLRRVLPTLLLEVLLAVTVGLLTEKAALWLQRKPEKAHGTPASAS